MMKKVLIHIVVVSCMIFVVGCANTLTPAPTITSSVDEEATQQVAQALSPTETEAPTTTPVPSDTPTPTPTETPEPSTATPSPTHTPTNTPTRTPTKTPTHTPTNTPASSVALSDLPSFTSLPENTVGGRVNLQPAPAPEYGNNNLLPKRLESNMPLRILGQDRQGNYILVLADNKMGWFHVLGLRSGISNQIQNVIQRKALDQECLRFSTQSLDSSMSLVHEAIQSDATVEVTVYRPEAETGSDVLNFALNVNDSSKNIEPVFNKTTPIESGGEVVVSQFELGERNPEDIVDLVFEEAFQETIVVTSAYYVNTCTLEQQTADLQDEAAETAQGESQESSDKVGSLSNVTVTPGPTPTSIVVITGDPKLARWPIEASDGVYSIAKTIVGSYVLADRIGNGQNAVVIVGGIHAGFAPASVEIVERMVDYYKENPDRVPADVSLYLISNANPDSPYAPDETRGRLNANGVDLNRNWGCNWRSGGTYQTVSGRARVATGTSAFSEAETQGMRKFFQDVSPRAVIFYSSISSQGVINRGICDGDEAGSFELTKLYRNNSGYTSIPVQQAQGDSSDWLASQGVPSIWVTLRERKDISTGEFNLAIRSINAVLSEYGQ